VTPGKEKRRGNQAYSRANPELRGALRVVPLLTLYSSPDAGEEALPRPAAEAGLSQSLRQEAAI
jgi:hypothetical protein